MRKIVTKLKYFSQFLKNSFNISKILLQLLYISHKGELMKNFLFSSLLVVSLASFAFGASSANKYISNSAYQKALSNIYSKYAKGQAVKWSNTFYIISMKSRDCLR